MKLLNIAHPAASTSVIAYTATPRRSKRSRTSRHCFALALFYLALAGRFLVALDTKCPRWRIARGKTPHQVAINLILAYLADVRLTSGPFEPLFVFRHPSPKRAHFFAFGIICTGIWLSF
jgi:hypothetical protein